MSPNKSNTHPNQKLHAETGQSTLYKLSDRLTYDPREYRQ